MKFVSFRAHGRETFGVVREDRVVELGAGGAMPARSLNELLALDDFAEMVRRVWHGLPEHGLDAIDYLPPIPRPGKILCVGVNYAERHEEYGDKTPPPAYPSIFMRTASSFVGHRAPLLRPHESAEFDYEGEVALVVGRGGRRLTESTALEAIAGITCANDGTLRDWVRHGKFNVTPGKNFERSGSLGPWLCTLDEAGPLDGLTVTTVVNGDQRQHDTTAHLIFQVPKLLAYISSFTTLETGDVILTGTPPGAGARRTPPVYLLPGDRVEVTVSGVGTLSNGVEDEPRP
ncbi:MAG: fumarylacetoacetate hydrolase family protein [Acidobacteria bacterium]|nr:fumarylacetoacetate hydrolase family protein [Acidobacteriota bacterium]